jgi:hypothetical protein
MLACGFSESIFNWLERKTLGLGEQGEEMLIRKIIGIETGRQLDGDGIMELLANVYGSEPTSFVSVKEEDYFFQVEKEGALFFR